MSNLRHALSDAKLEEAKESVQSLLTRVDQLLESNAAHAEDAARGVAHRVKRQAHGLRRMARSRNVKRVAARTDRYVHRNAWKSIGLAVVVGVVAGALSSATALRR
ncbi:Bacterial protein of uncharacterised function (DUF883) [Bordetella ansorpii]|uniref:Bacterial protein of uncharacterized function (DUF883) n=1 Tax=Bordetella ansorpii TaxID=288768 RepID=A0A157SFW4_9BORD|nr:DUF883 family protein [Bordetella ansorpii]SAI69289.1 Bacterial protein of uncharacterised function (DUF883) [Bordetella ansorpii]